MFSLLFIGLIVAIIILAVNQRKKNDCPSSVPTGPKKFIITNDDSVNGQINPFFCYGNPFSSKTKKASSASLQQGSINNYSVLGIGDNKGAGWQGGDSVGSIEL